MEGPIKNKEAYFLLSARNAGEAHRPASRSSPPARPQPRTHDRPSKQLKRSTKGWTASPLVSPAHGGANRKLKGTIKNKPTYGRGNYSTGMRVRLPMPVAVFAPWGAFSRLLDSGSLRGQIDREHLRMQVQGPEKSTGKVDRIDSRPIRDSRAHGTTGL